MKKVIQNVYGTTKDGEEVLSFSLTNEKGMQVVILNYGAVIEKLIVPDKNGQMADVVLGYANLKGYENNGCGHGSLIGRHANRIGNAEFTIGEKVYQLQKNDGENNLHGGSPAYNMVMYQVEIVEQDSKSSIVLTRVSPDMEQGFPGDLALTVTYTLNEENDLILEYKAVSDQDTVVNLTNHSYFNLAGHASGSVLNQIAWIDSDYITETNSQLIPNGTLLDVTNTPMDFRVPKALGQDIDAKYQPLIDGFGYDHNYVLKTSGKEVVSVASLYEPVSGRVMEVLTNKPGMQVYTANHLTTDKVLENKEGAVYTERDAVCFETQYYPNACNIESFPSSILKAGTEYDFTTIYRFTAK